MTNEEFSSELSITVDDYDACDWYSYVKDLDTDNVNNLYCALLSAARNEELNLSLEIRKVLFLLGHACSMVLQPNSNNEPFQPMVSLADGSRSWLPCDFTESDICFFDEVFARINIGVVKARIADVLWLCRKPKNPEHARAAIDHYIADGVELERWYSELDAQFERAYRIAKRLKDKTRISQIENMLLQAIMEENDEERSSIISIARLIVDLDMLREKDIIVGQRLEKIGEALFEQSEFGFARSYYDLAATKYQQGDDKDKFVEQLVRTAECYEREAEDHIAAGSVRILMANSLYQTAINAYRKIPASYRDEYDIEQRMATLREKLTKSGKDSLEEIKKVGLIETPVKNTEEIVGLAKEHVADCRSEFQALVCLASVCQQPDYEKLKQESIKRAKDSFASSLFQSTQYSRDGRVVATAPAPGRDENGPNEEAVESEMVRSFCNLLSFNTRLLIGPALRQVLLEHTITRQLIFEVCSYSTLVPEENIHVITAALWKGFEFDFPSAIFQIALMVEKIVKTEIKRVGGHTTTIDKNGIEHEIGLSSLLINSKAKEALGSDLLFELKAIYTDSFGPNLRNEVAHGLLVDNAAYGDAPVYAWWMLLRMVVFSVTK